MWITVYYAAILLGATATPSGYYHQQYDYKTSSSSYKNNELQHKTDDQGHYSKAGDLEGRVKPKVSSNSEHSEYINPQLREKANAGYIDAETDLTSHGNMLANSYDASLGGGYSSGYQAGSQYGNNLYSEGIASSDHIGETASVLGSRSSASYQSSYGSSHLGSVASRLEQDLQQEIREALRSQSQYSRQADISHLEDELHKNLTVRLNKILQEQYGTQTIRGGQSYSLTGGRLQAMPNYEQNDLENLQRRVENSLLQQLRSEYTHGASHTQNQIYNENYARYESTTYKPTTYRPIYPNLNAINTQRPFPEYSLGSKDSYYFQNGHNADRMSSNVQYTPVSNPISITTIVSNVQSQLDRHLNRLLEQVQTRYFSEDYGYTTNNMDSVLDRLRQELKNNLTYILDEELQKEYGTQVQKNNYMFSVESGGEISGQYNYKVADLENLRRQVESNLLTKLNRDFESARQRWVSRSQQQRSTYQHSQSSDYGYGSSIGNQRLEYSTPRYSDDDYYRPTSASIVPHVSAGIKGNQYHAISGSRQSSYGSSASSSNLVEIQRKLQSDLSRQLQAAIGQNQAYMSRYSTGTHGRSFEEAYQSLYDDLQRNLTQQLQEFEVGGSNGYSNSHSGVSEAQLANIKLQLQRNLASQLQSGLQQSYSASASYSASSGSSSSAGTGTYASGSDSSYRAARGSQTGYSGYGQYRSGGGYALEGEDCQGDDPNAYHTFRIKRSYGHRTRPLGLSTHTGSGYDSNVYEGYNGNFEGYRRDGYGERSTLYEQQPHYSVGQQTDNADITQEVQPIDELIGQQQIDLGQQTDELDDTQQIEMDRGFEEITLGNQKKIEYSDQQPSQLAEKNYTPQTEKSTVEKLQNRKPTEFYHKPSNQNIDDYEKVESGSQNQRVSSDLPQREYMGFGYFERQPSYTNLGSQSYTGQEVDDSELTQQAENISFEQFYPKHNKEPFDSDSNGEAAGGPNTVRNFGSIASQFQVTTKASLIRQFEPQYIGQQVDETDSTEQVKQSPDFGTLGFGSQIQIPTQKPQLTTLTSFYNPRPNNENTQFNSQYRPITQERDYSNTFQQEGNIKNLGKTNSIPDLTQQLERDNFYTSYDSLAQKNYQKSLSQSEQNRYSNNTFSTHTLTLNLPVEVKDTFMQVETNLTKQLESTIINDISYTIDPSELYQSILRKWQNNINGVCHELLKHQSQHMKINAKIVNEFKNYLETKLEKKIQEELQNFGFSRENLGFSNFGNIGQSDLKIQNANNESARQPSDGQRYDQYLERGSPKAITFGDYLQSSTNEKNLQLVRQHSYLLPTPSQVNNDGQLYGGWAATYPMSTAHNTNSQRKPWININSESSVNTPKRPITSTENFIPERQFKWEIGETGNIPLAKLPKPVANVEDYISDQKALQQSNSQWTDVEPLNSQPAIPRLNGSQNALLKPYNDNMVNLQDLSNYTPLPPSENSAPRIPPIQPRADLPLQPSSSQTFDKWQTNINEGQRHTQSLIDAEREAGLLITKLREAQLHRPAQYVNIHQQVNTNELHDSRTYYDRKTVQNPPNQYNIIQVKLENITPEQFKIISHLEKDFTKVIEAAMHNEIKTATSYLQLLQKLENEIKINVTDCIKGNVHAQLGTDNVDLKKYSTLIYQNFEEKTIPDLTKYLEIKLIKKIREQLRNTYKVDTEEAYELEHSIRTQTDQPYPSHEIIQIHLKNLSPGQLQIISQMENDIYKQIEAAIQTHLSSVTAEYLSSYENYGTSFHLLKTQLKNNITECVQGVTEPGISKYYEPVGGFDQDKIAKLEKYLEIKLTKTLRESLKTHFKFNFAESGLFDPNLNTDLSYNRGYQTYETGHQNGIISGYEHTVTTASDNVDEPITEKASWWQRFGNKVKQGATNIKKKIVGS